MTNTTFQTTQLDFQSIKNNLKAYFKRQNEFSDYDFEASGLSNILDVLAYNTHYNALFSNFALNEAYLSSAQLRSSVVSIAQTLGYNVRSRTASVANVELTLNLSAAAIKPTSITLPSGFKFTTSIDGVSYTFQTRSSYTAINDGTGIYTFATSSGSTEIPIYEGTRRTKTFIVQEESERQVFLIPDGTIDTSQAIVNVYDTYNSTTFTSYTNIIRATNINASSTFFKIYETPNSFYELTFGDGITVGLKPTVGNKVTIDYLSCTGPAANKASSFSPISQINVNGINYDVGVSVSSASHSGAFRQSIESIRQNAPLGFAAQQRLVTADDYRTTILTNFSSVIDAIAWGGEENYPPNYGAVYVGLLFDEGVSEASKTAVKDEISSELNENLAILSIDVEFVDPIITYLEIQTTFDFNPNRTSLTKNTVESQVNAVVNAYIEDNLKSFSGIFRKSNILSEVDDISPAILSSQVSVKLNQRLTPVTTATEDTTSSSSSYTLFFPVSLKSPDDIDRIITSTRFQYNGITGCQIKNKLNTNKLQIVDGNNAVIVDNIGSYEPTTGKISLVGFAPGVIASGDTYIKISAVPGNDNTLKPLRNYYFDIDPSISFASANIDRQNIDFSLT